MANSGVYSLGIRCAGDEMRFVYGPSASIQEQYREVVEAVASPAQEWIEIQGWGETPDRVDRVITFKREEITAVLLGEY